MERECEHEEERKWDKRRKTTNTTIARTTEATIVRENVLTAKSNTKGLLSCLSRSSQRRAPPPPPGTRMLAFPIAMPTPLIFTPTTAHALPTNPHPYDNPRTSMFGDSRAASSGSSSCGGGGGRHTLVFLRADNTF